MPIPADPRSSAPSSRTGRAASDSDSTTSAFARRPIDGPAREGCASSLRSPCLLGERAARSACLQWPSLQVHRHSRHQRIDSAWAGSELAAVPSRFGPMSAPGVLRRGLGLRWRLSIAGFHSRLRADCVCSLFFPRSVGFGPTASCAKGALTIAPSMDCQAQAMPSRSSYSASPFRHSRTKTPLRFHSWKYLWIELALPNRSSGSAFHWHPVRSTYTIPSNTLRASSGLRPPPGLRRYSRPFSRFRAGISGSTFAHIASDTVQDLIALMPGHTTEKANKRQTFIYG